MAEAVEALSLAANIIAVTEFGVKFITTAWKIWKSGKEGLEEITVLETLCRNLKDVSTRLERGLSTASFQVESNRGLSDVASQARKMAQDILESVQGIGVPAKRRKRDAVRTAFKLVWKEEDLHALQQRLDSLTNILVLNLAASVRVYAMQSLDTQHTILQEVRKIHADMQESKLAPWQTENNSKGFGSTIIGCLAQQNGPRQPNAVEGSLRSELVGAIYEREHRLSRLPNSSNSIVITPERKTELHKVFLSHLYYDGMYDRAEGVIKAHSATFRWIFEDDHKAGFSKWLGSTQQLYWITGKAGSGKSTLMKFISQPAELSADDASDTAPHPRCLECLRQWATDKPLIIASFYFWAAGSKTQRSREGLYRTLLHQILRDHPDVIARSFPQMWEALSLYDKEPEPFSEKDLRQGLLEAVQSLDAVAKICLLVDGLDEFDGKHDELISLFNEVISKTSIKVCVASRPWTVFEDAFRTKPSLRLEVLTYEDIKGYVTSRFLADHNFGRLQKREPQFADTIIENVVEKASGVFLWVNLVVTSLIDGMQAGDTVFDLQRRLDLLPPDLEDLYDSILKSLEPSYFEHAAQYFSLVRANREPPSAVVFYLVDELKPENPSFTLESLATKEITPEIMDAKVDALRRCLHSRCKGLLELEASGPANESGDESDAERKFLTSLQPKVQYLHKSVMDYIEKPSVEKKLLSSMKTPFDPHLRLASAKVAAVDIYSVLGIQVPEHTSSCYSRQHLGSQVFIHAKKVKPEYASHTLRLLDIFESRVSNDPKLLDSLYHDWKNGLDRSLGAEVEYFGQSFLSLAIKHGTIDYVRDRALGYRLDSVRFQAQYMIDVARGLECTGCSSPIAKLNRFAFHKRLLNRPGTEKRGSKERRTKALSILLRDKIPTFSAASWDPDLVQLLLERGADPNLQFGPCFYHGRSTWVMTLAALMLNLFTREAHEWRFQFLQFWLEVTQLMIKHGAHVNRKTILSAVHIVENHHGPRVSGLKRPGRSTCLNKSCGGISGEARN